MKHSESGCDVLGNPYSLLLATKKAHGGILITRCLYGHLTILVMDNVYFMLMIDAHVNPRSSRSAKESCYFASQTYPTKTQQLTGTPRELPLFKLTRSA